MRKDPALAADKAIAHGRKHFTGYEMPKIVQFSDEPLPKSAVGKVLRRLVREQSEKVAEIA